MKNCTVIIIFIYDDHNLPIIELDPSYIVHVSVINPRRAAAPRVNGYNFIVVGQSVCVCVYSESAHLDAIALCLYYGQDNKVVVLNLADFEVKASLSNKSEQRLRSLNRTVERL